MQKVKKGSQANTPLLLRRTQRRVGVLLELLTSYSRLIATSFARYASEKGDWSLVVAGGESRTVILGGFGEEDLNSLDGVIANHGAVVRPNCPVVYLGTPIAKPKGPVVCEDNEAIGRKAAAHLSSLGMTNYGFVGMRNVPFSEERLASFEAALREHGDTVQTLLFDSWLAAQHGTSAITSWLAKLKLPCAMLCTDDRVAANVSVAAHHAGLQVPEQLAILGVNDDDICCASVIPAISSIPIGGGEMGYEAARQLDRLMAGEKTSRHRITRIPPGEVVQRGSTQVMGYADFVVCEAMRRIRMRGPSEPVIVDQIADDLGVHRQQLNRSFSRHVGRSPKQEIDSVRGDRLRELLLCTALPIKLIAYEMGFASPSQLNRFCRRLFGQTPLEIREACDATSRLARGQSPLITGTGY